MKTPTSPEAEPSAAPAKPWLEMTHIPIEKLRPSPTNPRKVFPQKEQEELEASMRAHGFTISCITARAITDAYYLEPGAEEGLVELCRKTATGEVIREGTFPQREGEAKLKAAEGCFEIIVGERRWRAAKAVGIALVPAMITQLSDLEVKEVQLQENLKRKDLTAMEEAEAFRNLLQERDAEGSVIYTTATLAKKFGVAASTVQRRVALTKLTGKLRESVETGFLPPSTAQLIAMIPDATLREKIGQEVIAPKYETAPLSWQRTAELIKSFIRDLREAPFSQADAKLVPIETDANGERCAGGACRDCPLRTGNIQSLVHGEAALDNSQLNLCLNPDCFARKKALSWQKWQDEESDAAKNRRALSEEECGEIYRHGDQLDYRSGLVDLNQHPDSEQLKPGVETAPKWRALVKDSGIEVLVVRDRNGRPHELVKKELAIQAAENAGSKLFRETAKQEAKQQTPEERKAAWMAEAAEREREARVTRAKVKALVTKVEGTKRLPAGFWQILMQGLMDAHEFLLEQVAERRGKELAGFLSGLDEAPDSHVIGVLVELYTHTIYVHGKPVELLPKWAKLFEADLKAAEKAERAAIKQEEEAAAEEAEIAAGFAWESQREDAGEFTWEAEGCPNADKCKLAFRKAMKLEVEIYVAKHEKGYTAGFRAECGRAVKAELPKATGPFFSSRALALEKGIFSAKAILPALKASEQGIARMEAYHTLAIVGVEGEKPAPKAPAKSKKKGGAK